MGSEECSNESQQYNYDCFTSGALDQEAQIACQDCVSFVDSEMYLLVDATDCSTANHDVCLALRFSCVQDSCQSCAPSYQSYLLCELELELKTLGCSRPLSCDVTSAGFSCRTTTMTDHAAMGLAGLAVLYLARRMA